MTTTGTGLAAVTRRATNNQTTSDGNYAYTFDSEGNRARRTKVSDSSYEDYTWDHRNPLTGITRKSLTKGATHLNWDFS